ncbi:phosphatase PAP2 family protein [Amphritea japonica]|uniref:Phosphatidic acid phosphatase type 2/haloperoxidase domain-containing protein n=1 Tax=Amphritea japonica ATCC BAA-1530 TaxID=1278309 RepID=A0A7R6SRT6_9GAMM|nr:phosphatase PAP2 family protein [Amphritea japonica]BBB24782.1 conserved hypothetical protein [Amphritea japonica ATCC BAA-1530]
MSKPSIFSAFKQYRDLFLFLICVALLVSFPQIDLFVTGLFYDPQTEQFFLKHNPFFKFIYWVFAVIHIPLLLGLMAAGLLIKYKKLNLQRYKKWSITFLLLALIIGPGLLVNTVLKDNSIGRARPVQVENFGGTKQFTPAFIYSGECKRNCSFVSGHAAMGFYFMILGWLFASPRAFWAGCIVGVVLSFTRIIQGGHFFSDTVFAFWAVYFVTSALGARFGFIHPLRIKQS